MATLARALYNGGSLIALSVFYSAPSVLQTMKRQTVLLVVMVQAVLVIACDKDLLGQIVKMACSYNKRSQENSIEDEAQEAKSWGEALETEFNYLFRDSDIIKESHHEVVTVKETGVTEQKKQITASSLYSEILKNRWLYPKSLSSSDDDDYLILQELQKELDERQRERRANANKIIRHCCLHVCTYEDVRGICAKK